MPNDVRCLDKKPFRDVWRAVLLKITSDNLEIRPYGDKDFYTLWSKTPGKSLHILGYRVGLNTDLTHTLCRDKKLTHSMLSAAGVSVIEHVLILGSSRREHFKPESSQWLSARSFFEKHNHDVVIKPTSGSSGDGVMRVQTLEAMHDAFLSLDKEPSLVLTPFVASEREIRVMILPRIRGGVVVPRVAFLLEKRALQVVGDGHSTVAQLLASATGFPHGANKAQIIADLQQSTTAFDFDSVLPLNQVFSSWKFNESKGAAFRRVQPGADPRIEELALRAAAAVGLKFGAVDVLVAKDSTTAPASATATAAADRYTVLEVNTDVMLDVLELEDDAILALTREILDCRLHLSLTNSIGNMIGNSIGIGNSVIGSGPEAEATETTEAAVAAAVPSSESAQFRPATYVEKSSVRLKALQVLGPAIGLDHIEPLDHSHLLLLRHRDGIRRVVNVAFDFGITLSGCVDVTTRKGLTWQVLEANGVPAVPHRHLGQRPLLHLHDHAGGAGAEGGASAGGGGDGLELPAVLKMDNGSSGQGIFIVNSIAEAEHLLMKFGPRLVASPLLTLTAELRLVVLGDRVLLAFSKHRPSIQGDGRSTVLQLLSNLAASAPHKARQVERWIAEWPATAAATRAASLSLHRVPADGETVIACWKHNLDFGCDAHVFSDLSQVPPTAIALAEQTRRALGTAYCAVDVVEDEHGWKVLEVNSSPQYFHFLSTKWSDGLACLDAIMRAALDMQLV